MNPFIGLVFRLVPLAMGLICLAYGLDVRAGGNDAGHLIPGKVLVALAAICWALFTTAATIISQLLGRYGAVKRWALPVSGYAVAALTVIYGASLIAGHARDDWWVAGHVVVGIGLIAACVSTVAAASTRFVLIPANSHGPEKVVPAQAHSRRAAILMIAIPICSGTISYAWAAALLFSDPGGSGPAFVAGHVLAGLAGVCLCLVSLVASVVRQIRNQFSEAERYFWSWLVIALGAFNILWGLGVLVGGSHSDRLAPGWVLIGLGLVCFSILSKVALLALVWRRDFPLAGRVPLIPVTTALTCLFIAAFLFEAAASEPALWVPARVLVGLGAVCFTLFSIVSILEAGTSGKAS